MAERVSEQGDREGYLGGLPGAGPIALGHKEENVSCFGDGPLNLLRPVGTRADLAMVDPHADSVSLEVCCESFR